MVFEKVRKIIAQELDVDVEKITMETSVKDDFQADSLDLFQIITEIEDQFAIEIDIDSTEGIETVAQLVGLVEKLV